MDSLLCLTKNRFTAKLIPPSPHPMCLSVCGSIINAGNHCQGWREQQIYIGYLPIGRAVFIHHWGYEYVYGMALASEEFIIWLCLGVTLRTLSLWLRRSVSHLCSPTFPWHSRRTWLSRGQNASTENWPNPFMGLVMAIEMEEEICWRNMR